MEETIDIRTLQCYQKATEKQREKNTSKRYFEIGKLFHQIYKASAYNAQDLISSSAVNSDAIRYITRTDTNNGCKEFVQNENFTQIEQGNAITIGDTTATIYYQNEQFIFSKQFKELKKKLDGIYDSRSWKIVKGISNIKKVIKK